MLPVYHQCLLVCTVYVYLQAKVVYSMAYNQRLDPTVPPTARHSSVVRSVTPPSQGASRKAEIR